MCLWGERIAPFYGVFICRDFVEHSLKLNEGFKAVVSRLSVSLYSSLHIKEADIFLTYAIINYQST